MCAVNEKSVKNYQRTKWQQNRINVHRTLHLLCGYFKVVFTFTKINNIDANSVES